MLNSKILKNKILLYELDNTELFELLNNNIPITIEPKNNIIYFRKVLPENYCHIFTINKTDVNYHGVIFSQILDIINNTVLQELLNKNLHTEPYIYINKQFRFLPQDLDVNELNKLLDNLR